MGVICFGSLKGGVGKTSLSVNVAHAFAEKGNETLLIDLDPMGHASRFFASEFPKSGAHQESPLARLFLGSDLDRRSNVSVGGGNSNGVNGAGLQGGVIEAAIESYVSLIRPVRDQFTVLPSGPELRHFLWGRGARLFKTFFAKLIEELRCSYDYIIIDTPPDFNVLTRNAIAVSDLVAVPVDSSAMSIHCLEEIISSAAHIKGPTWLIVRSMVNKQASRVQKLSVSRLQENLSLRSYQDLDHDSDNDDDDVVPDISNPELFISMLEEREQKKERRAAESSNDLRPSAARPDDASPIFLLNNLIFRSEEQNRLTFTGKTSFDVKGAANLKDQYLAVARELDQMLSFRAAADPLLSSEEFAGIGFGLV